MRHTPVVRDDLDTRSFTARVAAAGADDALLVDAFLTHVRGGQGASDDESALIREVLGERMAAEAAV